MGVFLLFLIHSFPLHTPLFKTKQSTMNVASGLLCKPGVHNTRYMNFHINPRTKRRHLQHDFFGQTAVRKGGWGVGWVEGF